MRSRARRWTRLACLGALLIAVGVSAHAQQPPGVVSLELSGCDRENLTAEEIAACQIRKDGVADLRVNRVTVTGRWAERAGTLPLKAGDVLTPRNVSAAMEELARQIDVDSSTSYFETLGEIGILRISVNFLPSQDAGAVDVELVPRYVNLSLVKVGDNVLPIPRLRNPTPQAQIPAVLKWLNPSLVADYDQAFGSSLGGAIRAANNRGRSGELALAADGRVSMDESLHSANVGLEYEWKKNEGALRAATLALAYASDRQPLADDIAESDARGASAGAEWKIATRSRLYLDGVYRSTHDALEQPGAQPTVQSPGEAQFARVLFETIPPTLGFVRASLWAGTSSAGGSIDESYQTAILRLGYEREFSIQPGTTVGIEILAGGGRIWGNAPAYARFFGGSSPQKFLYDGASAQTMVEPPGGPPLRSFGQGEAGLQAAGNVVGGTRFWHFNVDITVPIRALSKPLIPDEDVGLTDSSGNPVRLKELMRRQVDVSGRSFLRGALLAQGMSEPAADARTAEVMDEIGPAARYVIRDANVFALKPLVVLDAAGLSGNDGSASWLSAGLGLQLTIVTARFEAGYARTVHGPTFGRRGAPFARLTFLRLF